MSKQSQQLVQTGYYKKRYQKNKDELKEKSKIRWRKKRLKQIKVIAKKWNNDLEKYLSRKIIK